MKNILLFIVRNHVLFLFVVLEVVCFSLIFTYNRFQHVSILNSSNSIAGTVFKWKHSATAYLDLKRVNATLATENAELRSDLPRSFHGRSAKSIAVKDSVNRQRYSYMAATVVNSTTDRRNNYLTIDKGLLQGVHPEMAVISSQGIVGIVKDVSKNYASVMSILHKNARISARLPANGYFGSLVWDGHDPRIVQLTDIPNHVKIDEGMKIETSGFSALFPKGILIGTVQSYHLGPGNNFYDINVKLSTEMRALDVVYVVDNLLKEEQHQLESAVRADD